MLMASANSKKVQLLKAIKANDIETVQAIVNTQPVSSYFESHNRHGESPLNFAVRCGSKEIIMLLVSHIDVNTRDKDGKTSLHEAVASDNIDIVNALIGHGAEVDCLKAADWYVL